MQRRHGGEHLLIEIFYVGNSKWLNALQFYKWKKSTNLGNRHLKASESSLSFPLPFEHLLLSNYLFPYMGRFFFNDFKPLYILDFYVMYRCGHIGCKMQVALPNARTTLKEKKIVI